MKINKENIIVEPLLKDCKKTVHFFNDRRLRSCTFFACNNSDLNKLSSFF
jgi:hypothetical protein